MGTIWPKRLQELDHTGLHKKNQHSNKKKTKSSKI